ncbi:iron-sulfur cluster assembly scaffold protein [[Acholeplasma] multilocale]|uniref:iron-sulfur cluster assembly scaffold protein n=1 Tax=[Acholeplasma] multilocale TaxID=264638 RepID=UPI00040A5496|nr:iron-sulfur cluster assembly scaffold protein [[Acholeplasma] multilocale]
MKEQRTDQELRQVIMKHFTDSVNKGFTNNPKAYKADLRSDSCSDELTVEIVEEDGIYTEIRFEGSACAISTSAADILISMIINKTPTEVEEIINNYEEMINNGIINNEESLGDLIAFKNIFNQRNRRTCATLGSRGFKELKLNNRK